MPLTNPQYETIMREYDAVRTRNENIIARRKEEINSLSPEYKKVVDKISDLSFQTAVAGLDSSLSKKDLSVYRSEMKKLENERIAVLKALGKPSDYLDPIYSCSACKDTGLINGHKCACLRKKAIELLYQDSNLKNLTNRHSFESFDLDYYPDDDSDRTGVMGQSSRDLARRAFNVCREFVRDFDVKNDNILLYGAPGLGKTYLSICIAKDLISTTHSVIYLSAMDFFAQVDVDDPDSALLQCDLLIIDDLGTELPSSFILSRLFFIINERHIREKSTIFSTNLNFAALRQTYDDRIFSRLTAYYKILKLTGNDNRTR